MITQSHAWDIEDGWCHQHLQFCSFTPTEPVDPMMGVAVADIDYAVHVAKGCPHNCGTTAEPIMRDGEVVGFHYRCNCSGCGIILRTD